MIKHLFAKRAENSPDFLPESPTDIEFVHRVGNKLFELGYKSNLEINASVFLNMFEDSLTDNGSGEENAWSNSKCYFVSYSKRTLNPLVSKRAVVVWEMDHQGAITVHPDSQITFVTEKYELSSLTEARLVHRTSSMSVADFLEQTHKLSESSPETAILKIAKDIKEFWMR